MVLREWERDQIKESWRKLQEAESVEEQLLVAAELEEANVSGAVYQIVNQAVAKNAADELSRHTNRIQ